MRVSNVFCWFFFFFVVFTSFYSVFVFVLYYVLPEWRNKHYYKRVLSVAHTRSLHGVFRPTEEHPASQYFDSVQRGSVSENSGLKTGDFLLEVGHIFTIPRVFTLFEDSFA